MKKLSFELLKTLSVAAVVALSVGLGGCEADSDGLLTSDPGDGIGDGTGAGGGTGTGPIIPGYDEDGDGVADIYPNDGSADTEVTEGGVALEGSFVCTESAQIFDGTQAQVGTGGLVGGLLVDLLGHLGAGTVTALLNSVKETTLAIDGTLDTASVFTLTLDLLGLLSSVDQIITLPSGTVVEDGYAVAALSFPKALLELTLGGSVELITYRDEVEQERVSVGLNNLDLLGLGQERRLFLGMHVTQPYDQVVVSLAPRLLTVNLGEAMKLHELCTNGQMMAAAP